MFTLSKKSELGPLCTLDLGVLSKVMGANGDVEAELQYKREKNLMAKENRRFPYFRYGTDAWERKITESEEHDRGDCFKQPRGLTICVRRQN